MVIKALLLVLRHWTIVAGFLTRGPWVYTVSSLYIVPPYVELSTRPPESVVSNNKWILMKQPAGLSECRLQLKSTEKAAEIGINSFHSSEAS
ncbi:hypothetical protein GE09DRAFT_521399 [Coniochaeta sp. 2T2.1]|nr:hypothetical protein GE09DRAFT_521399 [Coniochaeta sp. 2T2.1]